jgi:galactoside O-acetyltransferase
MDGFYTAAELKDLGLESVGDEVYISKKASLFGVSHMVIGHHVRIDDYCVLVGNIELHNYIHIGVFCDLHASKNGKIVLEDFSGLSSRVTIYASSDDFSGEHMMARPGVPQKCVGDICSEIRLAEYTQVGTGCTLLPGASLSEGTVVGAMSLVLKTLEPWSIYVGIPCSKIRDRSQRMLGLKKEYLDHILPSEDCV